MEHVHFCMVMTGLVQKIINNENNKSVLNLKGFSQSFIIKRRNLTGYFDIISLCCNQYETFTELTAPYSFLRKKK